MKQVLFRLTDAEDTRGAIDGLKGELSGRAYKNVLIHLYSGLLDRKLLVDMSKILREGLPEAIIAGTLSAGEIKDGRVMDDGVMLSALLFEETDVRLAIFDDVKGNEVATGQRIRELIDGIEDIKAAELLLPGTAFKTQTIFVELSECAGAVQVFGGYAGGHELSCEEHYVFNESGIYENAVFVITYAGKNFHITTDKSVGWQTLGMPFNVTKADDNRLIEINNRPAVEVYEKYLSIDRNHEFAENTFEFPLILQVPRDELLRHTMTVDDEGALILAGYVKEGMKVLLSYGNPAEIVKKVDERLEEIRSFAPEAILLYSCSVRKSFWEKFVNIEIEPFEKLAKTAGFFTWGEVKRNDTTGSVLEYNITLLSIAMREGEPKDKVPERVVVDDSALTGQASLIKRLSQLVGATTFELQKAFDVISEMNDRLLDMSIRDALTGLYNRGKIELMINEEIDKAHYTGKPLSLVMLDIDFFKKVNDSFGHAIGDEVLQAVSGMLSVAVASHPGGAVGRWGGEEFFAMLPEMDEAGAMDFAESLRKSVESTVFPEVNHLTVSMGIITTTDNDSKRIFTSVDDALYASKQGGRNRVTRAAKS